MSETLSGKTLSGPQCTVYLTGNAEHREPPVTLANVWNSYEKNDSMEMGPVLHYFHR